MYYFFAKHFSGKWRYQYKVYFQNQIEFYTKLYSTMQVGQFEENKEGRFEPSIPGTLKWLEVLFLLEKDLPDPDRGLSGYMDPERSSIKLKLEELNKS